MKEVSTTASPKKSFLKDSTCLDSTKQTAHLLGQGLHVTHVVAGVCRRLPQAKEQGNGPEVIAGGVRTDEHGASLKQGWFLQQVTVRIMV